MVLVSYSLLGLFPLFFVAFAFLLVPIVCLIALLVLIVS